MINKENAIILLDRNGLSYCTRRNQAPLIWKYPPEVVRDLEILHKDQLRAQLAAFIDTSKILPSSVIILLADAMLFVKDFLPSSPAPVSPGAKTPVSPPTVINKAQKAEEDATKREEAIKRFLDTVPFENVASKNYPIDKGVRVVAANRDFYEAVEFTFEGKGSTMFAVAPAFLVWKVNTPVALNAGIVSQLFGKLEFLKQ